MKKPLLWLLLLILLGIGCVLGGVFAVQKIYYLTFYEAVNKIAVKTKIVKDDARLLNYEPKWSDSYTDVSLAAGFPRINMLNVAESDSVRDKLVENLNSLSEQNVFKPDCNNANLLNALYCHSIGKFETYQLEQMLINFRLNKPNEVGSYGNGATYALTLDAARSIANLSKEGDLILQQRVENLLGHYLFVLDGEDASLFHGRSTLASHAMLLATQLNLTTELSRVLFSRAFGHFYDFFQAFEKVEVWPEGYNYWINERAYQVILAIQALKSVKGIPNIDLRANRLLTRIGLWHIYNTRPDWRMQGWGDEGPRTDLRDETSIKINILANVTGDLAIQKYARLLKLHFGGYNYFYGYKAWLPLTLLNDNRPLLGGQKSKDNSASLAEFNGLLPTSEIFGQGHSNHIVIRGGWGHDDTVIQIRASDRYTHHQHFDAGAFTLYKKQPIIVNASKYNGMFSENRLYFTGRSTSKNTVFVNSDDEIFQPTKHYELDIKDGGQRLPMSTHSNIYSFANLNENLDDGYNLNSTDLIEFDFKPGQYTKVVVDITRAYNSIYHSEPSSSAKVRRVQRQFLYVNKADTLFVLDSVVTTKPEYTAGIRFYVSNKPVFGEERKVLGSALDGVFSTSATNYIIKTPRQRFLMQSLLGVNRHDNYVVGGLHHRTYFDDFADSTNNGFYVPLKLEDNVNWFDKSDWRIEILDGVDSTHSRFLSVFEPIGDDVPMSKWSSRELGGGKLLLATDEDCVLLKLVDNELDISPVIGQECVVAANGNTLKEH